MKIQLLDCTLRDGGHLNESYFGEETIQDIISGMSYSRVDIVELGFIRDFDFGKDYAAVDEIEDFEKRFCLHNQNVEYSVMVQEDQYDIERLPFCKGNIKRIRVSFHDYDKAEGLNFCKEVIKKGYICHINPINITGYSDVEILELIEETNKMNAAVFTLVDTFGSMTREDLLRLFTLAHHNLKRDIAIGIHLHDNLQVAFALGQTAVELASDDREVIIDGSLLGMGRAPGNLCIELMMEYLNKRYGVHYDVDVALDLIDNIIMPLKQKFPWGYETAYSLSAQYKLHRSYAEFLIKKQKLKTKQIRQILGKIDKSKKSIFDQEYISEVYKQFVDIDIDDTKTRNQLECSLRDRDILLVAPGSSLLEHKDEILHFIETKKPVVLAANFKCNFLNEDYIFCSNIKRYDKIIENCSTDKVIVASHVFKLIKEKCSVVNTNKYAWFGNVFWDNCMLMLIHLIVSLGNTRCYIAGWDGFSDKMNFIDEKMELAYQYQEENKKVQDILYGYLKQMHVEFITPSKYQR